MSKYILALLASSALAGTAFAADLPSRRAAPVYEPAALPVFTWTGGYVGVTAGYAFDTDHNFSTVGNQAGTAAMIASNARPGFIQDRSNGFTGGGEIGYNYQLGNGFLGGPGGVVIGIEADAQYDGPGSNTLFNPPTGATTFHSRTDFVGTVRGRLGYAFDRFLVYGTGGFAYGGVHDNETLFTAAGAQVFNGNRSQLRSGYAFGGGVEYAIPTTSFLNVFHSSAVTLKAEFLHYDLGSSAFLVPGTAPATAALSYTATVHTQGNLVRAGLNYKFNLFDTPASPVVARY